MVRKAAAGHHREIGRGGGGRDAYGIFEKRISEAFSGELIRFEPETEFAEGEKRFISATYIPDRSFDGSVAGLVTLVEDLTQRKRAEESLHAAEEFNRRILESSDDCFKILDLEGRLIFMSGKSQDHLEIQEAGQVLGKPWVDFWKRPEDREAAGAALQTAIHGGRGHFLGYYRTPSGRREWWGVVITPMLGADGKPEKLLAVSRDETPMRRSEQILREAIQARDEFIAIASHELKTPITSMKIQGQMLERTLVKGDTPERAWLMKLSRTFVQQLDRLNQLVDDMLEAGRISQGDIRMNWEEVDAAELVEGVLDRLRDHSEAAKQQADSHGSRGIHSVRKRAGTRGGLRSAVAEATACSERSRRWQGRVRGLSS